MPRTLAIALLLAATLVLAAVAGAPRAVAQQAPTATAQAEPDIVDVVFSEIEKRVILDYYYRNYRQWSETRGKGKSDELPPGLAKRGSLPPGLARQLVRNGTLPPGLAKRSLPPDLVLRLPRRPDWQDIVIVDDKVLLIRRATNLILDILLVAATEAGG